MNDANATNLKRAIRERREELEWQIEEMIALGELEDNNEVRQAHIRLSMALDRLHHAENLSILRDHAKKAGAGFVEVAMNGETHTIRAYNRAATIALADVIEQAINAEVAAPLIRASGADAARFIEGVSLELIRRGIATDMYEEQKK